MPLGIAQRVSAIRQTVLDVGKKEKEKKKRKKEKVADGLWYLRALRLPPRRHFFSCCGNWRRVSHKLVINLLGVPVIPPAPPTASAASKEGHDCSEPEQTGGAQEGPHSGAELGAGSGGGSLCEACADHVEDDIVDNEGGYGRAQGQECHEERSAAA